MHVPYSLLELAQANTAFKLCFVSIIAGGHIANMPAKKSKTTQALPATAEPSGVGSALPALRAGAFMIMSPSPPVSPAPPTPGVPPVTVAELQMSVDLASGMAEPSGVDPGVGTATADPSSPVMAQPSGKDIWENLHLEHTLIESGFQQAFQEYMDNMQPYIQREKTLQEHKEEFAVRNFKYLRDKIIKEQMEPPGAGSAVAAVNSSAGEAGNGSAVAGEGGEEAAAPTPTAQPSRVCVGEAVGQLGEDLDPGEEADRPISSADGKQLHCHKTGCKVPLTTKNFGTRFIVLGHEYARCSACQRIANVVALFKKDGSAHDSSAVQLFCDQSHEDKRAWFQKNDTAGILAKDLKVKLEAEYTEGSKKGRRTDFGHSSEWLTPAELQMRVDKKTMTEETKTAVLSKGDHFEDYSGLERYEYRIFSSGQHNTEDLEREWKRKADQDGLHKPPKAPKKPKTKEAKEPAEPAEPAEPVWTVPKHFRKQVDKLLDDLKTVKDALLAAELHAEPCHKRNLCKAYEALGLQVKAMTEQEKAVNDCFDAVQVDQWPMLKLLAQPVLKSAKEALKTWQKCLKAFNTSSASG